MKLVALLLLALACVTDGLDAAVNPVTRVVGLLKEMKAQVEAEAEEDEKIYSKMGCWCETNEKEKTAAIKKAGEIIEESEATIEEGTATSARLTNEIDALNSELQADKDALDKATAIRESEREQYEDESKDLIDSIAALKEAIAVLKKVQLIQHKDSSQNTAVQASLLQVKKLLARTSKGVGKLNTAGVALYRSVMQEDLWDLMSSMPGMKRDNHVITDLNQQPTGNAAGATSYTAQSSSIFGMLQQMQETFEKNLAELQKQEVEAELAFQRLRAAKETQMQAAGAAVEEKTLQLTDTNERVAQAKTTLEDTKEALSADEKFLAELKERCANADADYEKRKATRLNEVVAISEAIGILTEDEARDLFSKTMSFVQLSRRGSLQQQKRADAASRLLAVARRQGGQPGGWRLAQLAVGVQIDGFTKVKEMMDKMVAELKKQQKREVEKHDTCTADIQDNERANRTKTSEKKDLDATIADLDATLKQLAQELEDLNLEVKENHIALKTASEQRKAENKEFQQVVSDQRATKVILTKALKRLQTFYDTAFIAVHAHGRQHQTPGAKVAPAPSAGLDYKQNSGAEGVLQMMEKVIQDAETADQEAVQAEQASQKAYGELVANTNAALDAAAASITDKTVASETAEADKIIAKKDLHATSTALSDLAKVNSALHADCDYVLKYFNIRQQARQEEIEAIQQAKAILSGADLGSA